MDSRSAINATLQTSMMVLRSYVQDLSKSELLSRPGDGCNHIAWQLGHLVSSQAHLLNALVPGVAPALPPGFADAHSKGNATSEEPSAFYSADEYLKLFDAINSAFISAINKMSDDDLDKPGPESFRSRFPTVGSIAVLMATHPLMHAGQIVPVRRKFGKPIVI